MLLELFLLLVVPLIILLIQGKFVSKGDNSDQYFHIYLIKSIKENKNRFITKQDYVFPHKDLFYPQLIHFLFAFFPISSFTKLSNKVPIIVAMLSNLAVYFYMKVLMAEGIIEFDNAEWIQFLLLFVLTPYTYNAANAKNTGFSARGFGLLLGFSYTFSMLFYVNGFQYHYWIMIAITTLMYMSSQFGSQFLILFSIILGVICKELTIAILPILGFMLFLLVHRKLAIVSFRGQFGHKRNYSKHLAQRFILQHRFSIWRDLIYDFYKMILKREQSFKNILIYIYTNNFVTILAGFPLLIVIAYLLLTNNYETKNEIFLSSMVLAGFLAFFVTSFRKTRFLGEPERYIEMIMPIIVLAFLVLNKNNISVYNLLFIIVAILLFDKAFLYLRTRNQTGAKASTLDWVFEHTGSNVKTRIISNNVNTNKNLVSFKKIAVFHNILYKKKLGSIEFKSLFKVYPTISPKVIPTIINEFGIQFLLLDKMRIETDELVEMEQQLNDFEIIAEKGQNVLYKIKQ